MSRRITMDEKEEEKMRNPEGGEKKDKILMNEEISLEKKEGDNLDSKENQLNEKNENLGKKKEETIKKKIFESFFLIGVGKEDLGDFEKGKNKGYLESKIIYDFPKTKEMYYLNLLSLIILIILILGIEIR